MSPDLEHRRRVAATLALATTALTARAGAAFAASPHRCPIGPTRPATATAGTRSCARARAHRPHAGRRSGR